MNEDEIKQINEMNKIITEDNDLIEQTLKKTKDALTKTNENLEKINNYLTNESAKMQNTDAQKYTYKIKKLLLDTQTKIIHTVGQIQKEQDSVRTRIYTELYSLPDEVKTDEKEKKD
jgi:hypothetical protein